MEDTNIRRSCLLNHSHCRPPRLPFQSSGQSSSSVHGEQEKKYVASGANLITSDKTIGNSGNIIHSIDKVLYPAASKNIVEVMQDKYDRMARYLSMSGLEKDVSNNVLTFFAPTDEAFQALPWPVAEQMLTNNTFLKILIENHIIPGSFYSLGLPGNSIQPIGGEPLNFTKKTVQSRDLVLVNSIPINQPDNVATNGLIHGITRVILPKKLLDDCKCDSESTTESNTRNTTPLSTVYDSSQPERYVAGTSDLIPSSISSNNNNVRLTPEPLTSRSSVNYNDQPSSSSDQFLRRAPIANSDVLIADAPDSVSNPNSANSNNNNNNNNNNGSSTTPFPYYNVWDDLVANHNLSAGSSQPDINPTSTSKPPTSERPRYFRTRLPSSSSSSSSSSSQPSSPSPSNSNNNVEREFVTIDQSPTPPPKFGVRRRVMGRPTQRPYPYPNGNGNGNSSNTAITSAYPSNRAINSNNDERRINRNGIRRTTSRPPVSFDNERWVPTVFYVDEPTTGRPGSRLRPSAYPPQSPPSSSSSSSSSSANGSPVTTPSSYYSGRQPAINDQYSTTIPPYLDNDQYLTTRRPFLRRPVARPPSPATSDASSASSGGSGLRESNQPSGRNDPSSSSSPIRPQIVPPSLGYDPSLRPIGDDPYNIRPRDGNDGGSAPLPPYYRDPSLIGGDGSGSSSTPVRPTARPTRPRRPASTSSVALNPFYPTEYYPNDMTTPSTLYFDSTRRPATRNPSDLWSSNNNGNNYDDPNSPNYVRRVGSVSPSNSAGSSSRNQGTQTSSTPSPYSPRYDQSGSNARRPGSAYQPTRQPSVQGTRGRGPKVDEPGFPSSSPSPVDPSLPGAGEDSNSIAAILQDPGLFLDRKPVSFLMFRDLLRRGNLQSLASTSKPITIFLPTDDAFATVNDADFDRIVREPSTLQQTLLRHIVNYPIRPDDMRDGLVLRTISNDPITITAYEDGKKVYANGAPILAATEATNGFIYVLGRVLMDSDSNANGANGGSNSPPVPFGRGKLLDMLRRVPEAQIFTNLIRQTDLARKISGKGPFTILVPDDNAMNILPAELREAALRSRKSLEDLLGNHIVNGSFDSNKLARSRSLPTLSNPKPLKVNQYPGTLLINNEASLRKIDLKADNGVIHLINRVLVPDTNEFNSARNLAFSDPFNALQPRIGTLLTSTDLEGSANDLAAKMNAKKFMQWLERSGTLNELKDKKKPYTVITPSDEAISKLPQQILLALDLNPRGLKSLLKYHVIPEKVELKNLKDGDVIESLDKRQVRFNLIDDGKYALSGAPVLDQYNESQINYITVDRVLYPPQGSIYQVIAGSPLLNNFTQIIKTANLEKEFTDTGPLTVLAPTDQAFKFMDFNEMIKITRDPKSAREFLLKHVLRRALFTSSIPQDSPSGLQAETLAKKSATFRKTPGYVAVDGATFDYADITANNGVLHVLNRSL